MVITVRNEQPGVSTTWAELPGVLTHAYLLTFTDNDGIEKAIMDMFDGFGLIVQSDPAYAADTPRTEKIGVSTARTEI